MKNTLTIALKETRTYFSSPMAYIMATVFLALTGYFFVDSISIPFPEATNRVWIIRSTAIFILWSPLLTMRLLAEEQKLGTLELLMTTPLRDYEIVLGKYLAALLILLASVVLTFFYGLLLTWFGDPDVGPFITGYIGLFLYGATTIALGLLASSLTGNQMVAAVIGFGALLLLTLIEQAADITSGNIALVLEELSLAGHFEDFTRGIIDSNNIVYYCTTIILFLFLTVRSIESRRWR
jgi:ABC-2 type transport system permease protein